MKKMITAGVIALTLGGAGLALAQQGLQQGAQQQGAHHREGRGFRPSAEDAAAFTDARVAALKAGLKLTAEQEKNWPAVETAIRDLAKQRADRMKQRADLMATRREARRGGDNAQQQRPERPDAIARLRRGAEAMDTRATALKKLADAADPLYKTLDDGQKHRFGMLLRMGGRGHGGQGHHHGHWQRRADNAR